MGHVLSFKTDLVPATENLTKTHEDPEIDRSKMEDRARRSRSALTFPSRSLMMFPTIQAGCGCSGLLRLEILDT